MSSASGAVQIGDVIIVVSTAPGPTVTNHFVTLCATISQISREDTIPHTNLRTVMDKMNDFWPSHELYDEYDFTEGEVEECMIDHGSLHDALERKWVLYGNHFKLKSAMS